MIVLINCYYCSYITCYYYYHCYDCCCYYNSYYYYYHHHYQYYLIIIDTHTLTHSHTHTHAHTHKHLEVTGPAQRAALQEHRVREREAKRSTCSIMPDRDSGGLVLVCVRKEHARPDRLHAAHIHRAHHVAHLH